MNSVDKLKSNLTNALMKSISDTDLKNDINKLQALQLIKQTVEKMLQSLLEKEK